MILFKQFYNVILDCLMKENSKRGLELTKSEDRPWAQLGPGVLGQPFSAFPNKTPTQVFDQQTELTSITRWLKLQTMFFSIRGDKGFNHTTWLNS